MPGTGTFRIGQIPLGTAVEDYSGNDIKPVGVVWARAAKVRFGDSTNINQSSYCASFNLQFDPTGLITNIAGSSFTVGEEGLYQLSFHCRTTGGIRTNAGFRFELNGNVQPERFLSNYSRGGGAQQGGTHNFGGDGGTLLYEFGSASTIVRILGSQQGNSGTVTALDGAITIIKIR